MHDDLGALEYPTQIGDSTLPGQIERAPISALVDALRRRWTAHDSDNIVFGRKNAEQSRSYVATRSGDHDAHRCASNYFWTGRTRAGDSVAPSVGGGGWDDVVDAHPPDCAYLLTARLVAISTSAVAWMRASSSLSKPGANSSRRSGAIVIGNPSGMTAVLSSVPSFDGDAPRYSLSAWLSSSALKVYWILCRPTSRSFLT